MLDIFLLIKIKMQKKAYLGIDVSKGYADFVLLDSQCIVLEDLFQLNDTFEGRNELKKLIDDWRKKGLKELYCGVESTGGYENNWYSFLKGLQTTGGIWSCRLNAKAVKSVSDASLRRTITDGVSALNIASYLVKYPEKIDYGLRPQVQDEQFKEGRQFATSIRMWSKQKVQLGNQLEKLVYQQLPELLVYCRHGMPGWLLRLLVKYPTAAEIKKAGEQKISKINGISKEKAAAVLKKLSTHERPTSKAIGQLISITSTEVLHQQELVTNGKSYLSELYQENPSVKILSAIKGIGIDSAVSIILEIEDINRFEDAKKMASYFGVHPRFKQSGDGLWGNHMSKTGRGEIRAVLYMVSLSAVRYNDLFKKIYANARAKGMKHKAAAGVVMHKMLRVIFGVLKSGKPFDAAIEAKRRTESEERQAEKKKSAKEESKSFEQKRHRFQTILETAPVSGRNIKTRKKWLASQTSKEVDTGSPSTKANI
jgi:transposase